MKKNNLILPKWSERKPLLLENMLFVPGYYDKHDETDLHIEFLKKRKIAVEYCSGNGSWICSMAKNNPQINWIAVEKRLDRAKKVWKKIGRLDNLQVVYGRAETFTKYYIKERFEKAYINFPDPWPKKKHEKHRLINKGFLQDLFSSLTEQGAVFLATDDDFTCRLAIELLQQVGFVSEYKEPYYITRCPEYGESFFLNLWQKKGFSIKYIHFKKTSKE